MSGELDGREEPRRPPPPWGDEITPLTEVCGGQYVLLDEIARGDLSAVYRAKPAGSREVIAFKVIQPRYANDQAQVRRFRREAELLRRIEHPNVVRLVDHGTIEDGRNFVALELLTGRTLGEALTEAERMTPERTCRIARQIGRALRVMHKAGVIHRDLKPENILLIGPEDGERVKLVDFSEAGDVGAPAQRVRNSDRADDDEAEQQPSYRPPEQVRKRPPQPTMDVFALGVLMFEMLTGQHPFVEAKDKLGQTIRSQAFDAPEVMLRLVGECIEHNPKERPRSMDEVLERLDKALLWMGVVPHELSEEADEDERTQPYTVADPGHEDEDVRARRAAVGEVASRPKTSSREGVVAGEVVLSASDPFDEDLIKTQRRRIHRGSRSEADDLDGDDDVDWVPTQRRRVRSDRRPSAKPAGERGAGESWEEGRRASRESWDEGRRAGRETRDESGDEIHTGRGQGSEEPWEDDAGRRGPRDSDSGVWNTRGGQGTPESWDEGRKPRRDSKDESWDESRGARRSDSWSGDDRGSSRRSNADGPSSDSKPRIDLDDLREGNAPEGPRFVVDTVAWTKQQPSARPEQERRRHIRADDDEPSKKKVHKAPRPRNGAARANGRANGDARPKGPARARPPTASRAPVDPIQTLPRWVLPLLVMVLIVLAYAVWVVWTQ